MLSRWTQTNQDELQQARLAVSLTGFQESSGEGQQPTHGAIWSRPRPKKKDAINLRYIQKNKDQTPDEEDSSMLRMRARRRVRELGRKEQRWVDG